MIIIVDDTFKDRHKFHNVEYLKNKKYRQVCTVHSFIKTIDLVSLIEKLKDCKLFCNHKTLQLYDSNNKVLNLEDNTKYRENILNKVTLENIPRIEFSRGLETDIAVNKIDKDLFYSNLKAFLDYYIDNKIIETKILFWGNDFEERERLSVIQNMLMQIRMVKIEDFNNNTIIEAGIEILYPQNTFEEIINKWKSKHFSKNDIINEINNHIK